MEEEFNFREKIRENPRIVNENDLQNMGYIELSFTGELIPVEEVEGIFDEFIKRVCSIVVNVPKINKIKKLAG